MLVCITTYKSIKTANATTSNILPLMNTPFLMSLLHCDFEVNCGLNTDCIVDNVGIYRDDDIVNVDRDEDIITETKNKNNVLYSYI